MRHIFASSSTRLNLADRASFGIVDLEDDKVPGREHDVEIVRVDPEQDRGHSTHKSGRLPGTAKMAQDIPQV